MKHETFRTIVGSKNYTMPATNLHPEPRIIRSTNALISNFRVAGYIYEYATGIKTGSTPEAGYCLAASATRENRNLISVVMGCEREPGTSGSEGYIYFDETIRLFKWGFANFSTQTILDNTKRDIPEVEVTLGKDAASVTLMPDGKLTALLPNDVSAENFTYDYTLETRAWRPRWSRGRCWAPSRPISTASPTAPWIWWPPARWSGTPGSTGWTGFRSSLTTCWCASFWWSSW